MLLASRARVRRYSVLTAAAIMLLALPRAPVDAVTANAGEHAVSVRQETIVIPTYPTGEPLKAPMFFAGRTYQGAKGPMYPYVLVDRLRDRPQDRRYTIIWLENEFVRIGVLPELGGRIWAGTDKTNGYDFFYRNRVIKPALIGMVGAWISGGVEWNLPHHHRASSFLPVDYRIEERADGSRTVWVGELEYRHRMRWTVGLTISPGSSVLDATVRLVNRTPVAHSFLYFANVAVHANADYQVVFPPRTAFGTHHAKREFTRWPVSDGTYGGVDFTGVDVSWWKNHPVPTSIFAWNHEDDFLAGYDHGRRSGTLHVADHHTVPGKKFFEWGPGEEGRLWDSLLTDADGAYLELMVGGYSDNQPDYAWIQPGETKTVSQAWYPIRDLGGVTNATRDAAVNLAPTTTGHVRLAFNATTVIPDARVTLEAGERALVDRQVAIGPASPFSIEAPVPPGTPLATLRATLRDGAGRVLVTYEPRELQQRAVPPPVVPPVAPSDIRSNEELFIAGLRLEQFHSPASEPEPYYEEAMRRDPADARAHEAMARLLLKRGLYADAATHAAAAVARVSHNYTSPEDAGSFYYLGVAQIGLGNESAAEEALGKSTWDPAWRAAGYTRMAEISARRRDWSRVVAHTAEALASGQRNTRAWVLHAIAWRQLMRPDEARAALDRALSVDPLDAWAEAERRLAPAAAGRLASPHVPRGNPLETLLEVATDYAHVGLHGDALREIEAFLAGGQPGGAMLYYVAADCAARLGRADAAQFAARARTAPPDYVFPFRLEDEGVLARAMARDPDDARAPYYLGNLLIDVQPARAVAAWETAARLQPSFAMVHRNLGWAAARVGTGLREAITHYERAVAADPREPVYFYELDRLYEAANTPAAVRLALLDAHKDTIAQRDDATSRLVGLYVQQRRYDDALNILERRTFHTWEGGTRFLVHDQYVDAHLLRGRERLAAGDHAAALEDFQAALEYPANLGAGRPERGGRTGEALYLAGLAHEAGGHGDAARRAWQRAAADAPAAPDAGLREPRPLHYFQARALERLKNGPRARALFEALVAAGRRQIAAAPGADFFAKFGERPPEGARRADAHYLLGLGLRGLGREQEAHQAFTRALEDNVNHLGATTAMRERLSR